MSFCTFAQLCVSSTPSFLQLILSRKLNLNQKALPLDGIEAVYIHIQDVSVHHNVSGWILLAEPYSRCDILKLVIGISKTLADKEILVGKYSQLPLNLGTDNGIGVVYHDIYSSRRNSLQTGSFVNHIGFERPGDSNMSGAINITDLSLTAQFLFSGYHGPSDCNQSGSVNITDMSCVATQIF